jgi:hypothetical protein
LDDLICKTLPQMDLLSEQHTSRHRHPAIEGHALMLGARTADYGDTMSHETDGICAVVIAKSIKTRPCNALQGRCKKGAA